MEEDEKEQLYKYYYDKYLDIIGDKEDNFQVLGAEDFENKPSFNDYISMNIMLNEMHKTYLQNQLYKCQKRLRNNKSLKKIGYISEALIAANMFDVSNLFPFIFPGTIYISSKVKDNLEHNKYVLCRDIYGFSDPVLLKFHKMLKGAFICVNVLAVCEMKKYYDNDIDSFRMMLLLIIIGFIIKIQNKQEEKIKKSIIRNIVKLGSIDKILDDLNILKEYDEKERGESYVK